MGGACLLGLVLVLLLYFLVPIPDPNKDFQAQTTHVYYNDGSTSLGQFATQNRESVPLRQVPRHVQDAMVAAEDRTFWTNNGIDVRGIARAVLSNAEGNAVQGASTITQQYVKLLYLNSERTLVRKAKEAIVALKLQQEQSKQQVLQGYLNTIYFGRGAYGIQAAAQAYFNKDASELSVKQGAVLASVVNSPANYDPDNGSAEREALLARYRYVLDGMVAMHNLGRAKAARLKKKLPRFPKIKNTNLFGGQRGFMLAMVRDNMHALGFNDSAIDGGGLKIVTTFSRKNMAEVRRGVLDEKPTGLKGLHIGAATIDVHSGAVRAVYGGQDYLKSQINWAVVGAQPGSTFKPFALAAGLQQGFSLNSYFEGNSPYTFADGTTVSNEGEGEGNSYGSSISLLYATQESVNTAYVDLTEQMRNGPQAVLRMAQRAGIPVKRDKLQPTARVALGQDRVSVLDILNGYTTFANGGMSHPWFVVRKVVRASDGKVLYDYKPKQRRAVSADIAADVTYALQQVVSSGTGTAALEIGRSAAGKTGTATAIVPGKAEHVSSAWFVGFTPQLATAVMYCRGDGNDPLDDGYLPYPYSYFGAGYPAHTWSAIMLEEMAGMPYVDFPPPAFVSGNPPDQQNSPSEAPTVPSGGYTPYATSTPETPYNPPAPANPPQQQSSSQPQAPATQQQQSSPQPSNPAATAPSGGPT